MAHNPQALTIEAGTSKTFSLILLQDDGVTVLNPAGGSITFLAKRNLTDPDSAAAISKTASGSGITIIDTVKGQIAVALVPADTAGITATTTFPFAIKVIFSSTSEQIGVLGTLTVQPVAVASI